MGIKRYAHCLIPALVTLIIVSACGGKRTTAALSDFTDTVYSPEYASGFDITRTPDSDAVMITVRNPWQGADSVVTRLLILPPGVEAPAGYDGQVLHGNASRIAAMSSTHIAMLDAFGQTETVKAVSGMGYISNPYIRANADSIVDVGPESSLDYEALLGASPDIVLLYGISAASPVEGKLKELGIPFVYVGDYLEESPLGKAEWMVMLGELTGHRSEAMAKFRELAPRYNALKELVANGGHAERPKVMLNIPYGDSWFLPPAQSYMVRLITDAGGDYVYPENTGNSSVPVDMEKGYMLASGADRWINAGDFMDASALKTAYPKFKDIPAVREGYAYSSNLRATPGGGNDFFESGVVNPDLVLRDLIKIFYPELLSDSTFVYYRQLR